SILPLREGAAPRAFVGPGDPHRALDLPLLGPDHRGPGGRLHRRGRGRPDRDGVSRTHVLKRRGQNVRVVRKPSTASFLMREYGLSGLMIPPPGLNTNCESGCRIQHGLVWAW